MQRISTVGNVIQMSYIYLDNNYTFVYIVRMGNNFNKTDYPKIKGQRVIAEPELHKLARLWSKKMGCYRPEVGSESEFWRRAGKTALLKLCPTLKNVKGIDWGEVYTSYNP